MAVFLISSKTHNFIDLVFTEDDIDLEVEWYDELPSGSPRLVQEEKATEFLLDRDFVLMKIESGLKTRMERWER